MSCYEPRHEPVIAGLIERGVPADEAATGGNFYHVSWPHPSGGFYLADANDGWWRVGVYVKTDEPDWYWNEAVAMHDSALLEDAAPAVVVAWLLEVTR